jgi:alpha-ketoglutarate-dependent taurine dioxygenase
MNSVATTPAALTATPRHPVIGTEVRGVDLRQPLDADTVRALCELWLERPLLIFPEQASTDA